MRPAPLLRAPVSVPVWAPVWAPVCAWVCALACALVLVAGCTGASDEPSAPSPEPAPGAGESPTDSPAPTSSVRAGPPLVVRTVAARLAVPWGVAVLPDGSALVGERDTARVLLLDGGEVREVGVLGEAAPSGEGGLLGLAVSPTYSEDSSVYAYYSTASDNRVVRVTFDGRRLGPPRPVLTGIPVGSIHDGGRLAFGPDGYLYVSTGETGEDSLAQDQGSLAGKVLRITPDGDPAPGNPRAGSPVWTSGHRNVQGLAFDDRGRMWASEFGASTWDELNLLRKGGNYGWPMVEGRGGEPDFRDPLAQWHTDEASPSGLAYLDGYLWMASLHGERLWRIPVTDTGIGTPRAFFVGEYGRMRTVLVAPDGEHLWVTTSNRDGRGSPASTDDRILLVDPGTS